MVPRCSLLAIGLIIAGLGNVSWAGKYNQKLDIGDQAPSWKNLASVGGKTYSAEDFAAAEVLVLVFTSNTCPYALDYEGRLKSFQQQYADNPKVKLVVMNPNAVPEDSLEAMEKRAKEQEFQFLYLKDEAGDVAQSYGALRTPECFVIDAQGRIIYMGAFDDETDASKVKSNYVSDAVEAALAGKQPAVQETPPVGCSIRKRRRR